MTTADDALSRLEIRPQGAGVTLEEARRYVRGLTTGHYENFSVLSRLVPADLRDDFAAVYAYCRWSDDLADETGADESARARSLELLSEWRRQLRRCFAFARGESDERPRHAVYVTLAETVRRRGLLEEPFQHLLDAFEQDQRVRRYETWEQVVGYCTRSADPVGRIILMLDGRDIASGGSAELVRMSDATCTALQLTNFWQDVRRDLLERDRVYIPAAETGLTGEMLREWSVRGEDPAARVPFIRAVRPLVERTRELFRVGRPLPRALGSRLSPVVWLFGAGGESVLDGVEGIGCATLWERPRLGKGRKAALVVQAGILHVTGLLRSR
ncbi:MAG: squalene/phytoene synthase family protein [Planctomycetota bacterium]|nr:squalene/phytoene synthase family protein [Planctomycetota bacterium]